MIIAREALRWNGWGPIDQPDPFAAHPEVLKFLAQEIGAGTMIPRPAVALDDAVLSPPLDPSARDALAAIVGAENVLTEGAARAMRAGGKGYRDLMRLRNGDALAAPGAVVLPANAAEGALVLKLLGERGLPAVPFGGGTSVVGGVTGRETTPWIAIDTMRMDQVRIINEVDRTATIGAGIQGPALEAALNERGYTLGHYPQSFLYSTLGGWIAANGAGQQSGRYGRPHNWLVGAEMVTPVGIWRTGPFRHSSAGPWLGNLMIGSEGSFGIITEATVAIRPMPETRDYRGYVFPDFQAGSEALRACVQNDLGVAMLRLSDEEETRVFGMVSRLRSKPSALRELAGLYLRVRGAGKSPCFLVAGFEGSVRQAGAARKAAERNFRACGGIPAGSASGRSWWRSRFDSPSMRDPLLDRGIGLDTIETATTWSKLDILYAAVGSALRSVLAEASPPSRGGVVMAHISHCYPEGASLYFTFLFPQRPGEELEQWQRIKGVASAAIISAGGTISHHHGVGSDHVAWMNAEKGELEIGLLRAAKRHLDPSSHLNPGKLVPES